MSPDLLGKPVLGVLLQVGREGEAPQALCLAPAADPSPDCASGLKGIVCPRIIIFRIIFI